MLVFDESIITRERRFAMDFVFIFVIEVTKDKTIKTFYGVQLICLREIRGIISCTYNYLDTARKKNTLSLNTLQNALDLCISFVGICSFQEVVQALVFWQLSLYILYHLMQWCDTKSIIHCNIRHDYFYRLVKLQRSISAVMFVTFPFTYDFCMKEHFVYTFFWHRE